MDAPPPPSARVYLLDEMVRKGLDPGQLPIVREILLMNGVTNPDTVDASRALLDPDWVRAMPRDVRRYFMLIAVDQALGAYPEEVCMGVANIVRLGYYYTTMQELLDTRDDLWERFFAHDFARFGEQARLWSGHNGTTMPWRRAYLWTVFFRRRCLKEMANVRTQSALEMRAQQYFKAIPFGHFGCVTALAVYRRNWGADRADLEGYVGAVELAREGQFAHPPTHPVAEERVLLGMKEHERAPGPAFVSPARSFAEMFTRLYERDLQELSLARQDQGQAPVRFSRQGFLDFFRLHLDPSGGGSLVQLVTWDYIGGLFAYAYLAAHGSGQANLDALMPLFDSLPDEPSIGANLYLGKAVHL